MDLVGLCALLVVLGVIPMVGFDVFFQILVGFDVFFQIFSHLKKLRMSESCECHGRIFVMSSNKAKATPMLKGGSVRCSERPHGVG